MKKKEFDIKKLGILDKNKCFICESKIPKEDVIYEDDKFIAFLDLYPPTKGYTILALKEHIEDITEIKPETYLEFQKLLYKISKAIKKAFRTKRICLMNTGGILKHWHFHIIPMYQKIEGIFMDVFLKRHILELSKKDRIEIVKKIKKHL